MKLKKFVYTSAAALTLFSAGAALTQAQNSDSVVQAATTKKKVMHNAYHYEKDGETIIKTSKGKNKMSRSYTYVKVSKKVTINGNKFYKISGKDEYIKAGNIDGTKRKLTHNAYVYTSKGKRKAGVKTLKKGKTVTTYGSSHIVKQNGVEKVMYRIAPGEYIKAANFKKQAATPAPEKKPTTNTNASSNNINSSSNSASTAEYQSWLDNRDDGVMVAIRDTSYATINHGTGHITKGRTIEIPDDNWDEDEAGADIVKGEDGKIYIRISGPDDVVYYPAANFTFNAYKKTSEYKNLVKKYIFDYDRYSGAKVTVNGPVYTYYTDSEKVHNAGDSFVLEDAEIILNNKGGYSLVGNEKGGYYVEIPVSYIASYNLIPKEDEE